jgi:hypothetical protein
MLNLIGVLACTKHLIIWEILAVEAVICEPVSKVRGFDDSSAVDLKSPSFPCARSPLGSKMKQAELKSPRITNLSWGQIAAERNRT